MINKSQLQNIAKEKLEDAESLHRNGKHSSAFYISGYTLEIFLKSIICDTLNWDGYPSTNSEFQGFTSFKTHNLENLLRLTGKHNEVFDNHLKL